MQYFNEIEQIISLGEVIPIEEFHGISQKRELVFCRQAVMYFLKEYVEKVSWRQIGNQYGKDHATAMHAVKTINNLIETDKSVKIKIAVYRIRIEHLLNFEKNLIGDKLMELKEWIRLKLENNEPLSYEHIIIYNKLIEKVAFIPPKIEITENMTEKPI